MRFEPLYKKRSNAWLVGWSGFFLGWIFGGVELPMNGVSHIPKECNGSRTVPRVVFATGWRDEPTWATRQSVSHGYELRYYNDSSARLFLQRECGAHIADAFDCLLPGAFRADLFRMCALYVTGGVYMDGDLLATKPLDDIFSPCQATIAWDRPAALFIPKKQMAFVASPPQHPLFLCHMRTIVRHVRERYDPWIRTAVTGPVVFESCYQSHGTGTSVALVDLGPPRNVFARAPVDLDYPDVVAVQLRTAPGPEHHTRTSQLYSDACVL